MASSASLISETTKKTLSELLSRTARTPKPITIKQLVIDHRAILRKMLKNGHSTAAITAVLATHNLTVAESTIEAVLASTSKKKGSKAKELPADAAQTVNQTQTDAIITEWTRLSAIRNGFLKRELVAAMGDEIDAALKAGYDYADITQLMSSKGVTIAAGSLKKYHRGAQRKTASDSLSSDDQRTFAHDQDVKKTLILSPLTDNEDLFTEGYANV